MVEFAFVVVGTDVSFCQRCVSTGDAGMKVRISGSMPIGTIAVDAFQIAAKIRRDLDVPWGALLHRVKHGTFLSGAIATILSCVLQIWGWGSRPVNITDRARCL